jgi:nucleoside-diphosphate-sugar epimerase
MAISTTNPPHALVIGATGVSGWALCLQLLKSDTPLVFQTVTLTTLRPVSRSQAQWPEDSRLRMCSGIDLNRPGEEVIDAFRSIPGIANVTHVFYVGMFYTSSNHISYEP